MFWVEQEEILQLQTFSLQALQTVTIKIVVFLITDRYLYNTIHMFQWFNNGIKHQINLQQLKALNQTVRAFLDHLLLETHRLTTLECLIDPLYQIR